MTEADEEKMKGMMEAVKGGLHGSGYFFGNQWECSDYLAGIFVSLCRQPLYPSNTFDETIIPSSVEGLHISIYCITFYDTVQLMIGDGMFL